LRYFQPSWLITGLVVTLTCYISHSAKHRKVAELTPQGAKTPEPISMKLGMSGTQPQMTTTVGVVQRGWSWQICNLSHPLSFFNSIQLVKSGLSVCLSLC